MKRVIRLGDPTTHGGTVVSASPTTIINGKPVARLGDSVTCPLPGHGVVTIVEGDPTWLIDGRPVALEGHKTSCGASLISTLGSFIRSPEGAGETTIGASASSLLATLQQVSTDESHKYNHRFLLLDSLTNVPLTRQPYRLEHAGKIHEGETDEEGLTALIGTGDFAGDIQWQILGEAINE